MIQYTANKKEGGVHYNLQLRMWDAESYWLDDFTVITVTFHCI